MMQSITLFTLLGLTCPIFTEPIPKHLPDLLEPRDNLCSADPRAVFDGRCWKELEVTQWLTDWAKNVPRCGSRDDGIECCGSHDNPNEPWSTCFLRLTLGNAGFDCTKINIKHCQTEGVPLVPSLNGTTVAQYRYVIHTIFAMNSFFTDWFVALKFATQSASLQITKIITLIDPPNPKNWNLNNVLSALGAGLAILGGPEIGPALNGAIKGVAATLAESLRQAPGVGKAIWPAGTDSSQTVQIGELSSELDKINTGLSDRLGAALFELMTNVDSFTQFASAGGFSGAVVPSLPEETAVLAIALKAYVLTYAMDQNQWSAFWGPNPTDGLELTQQSMATNFGCTPTPWGVCYVEPGKKGGKGQHDGWAAWASPTTGKFFSPQKYFLAKNQDPKAREVLHGITDDGWGTLQMVFDGSYNCSQSSKNGDPKPVVRINDQGGLDMSCIGQLKMGTGCGRNTNWATANAKSNKDCTVFWGAY